MSFVGVGQLYILLARPQSFLHSGPALFFTAPAAVLSRPHIIRTPRPPPPSALMTEREREEGSECVGWAITPLFSPIIVCCSYHCSLRSLYCTAMKLPRCIIEVCVLMDRWKEGDGSARGSIPALALFMSIRFALLQHMPSSYYCIPSVSDWLFLLSA